MHSLWTGLCNLVQRRRQEFSLGRAIARGLGTEVPQSGPGRTLVKGLGDEISQKLEQFANIV